MVNVGSGNLLVQADDVDIHERGIDLAYRRTYNSMSGHDASNTDQSTTSNFGNGWTSTFDAHVAYYNGNNVLSVYDIDGTRYDYTASGGLWLPPPGMQGTSLAPASESGYSNSCYYQWTKKDGTAYIFYAPDYHARSCAQAGIGSGLDGRIAEIFGRNSNNYVQFNYSWQGGVVDSGHLGSIVALHADGQQLVLSFALTNGTSACDGSGPCELHSITRPDNQAITYSYDSSGDIVEVDLPGNNANATLPQTYGYKNGTLWYVTSPRYVLSYRATSGNPTDGNVTYFGYSTGQLQYVQRYGVVNFTPNDGTGALLQPSIPSGIRTYYQQNFSGYNGSGCATSVSGSAMVVTSAGVSANTSVTDTDGHSTTYATDGCWRLSQTQDYTASLWLVRNEAWDDQNDLTASTDDRANETDYAYDAHGNTTEVALPATGSFRPTSLYSYDPHNNLTAYCDPIETNTLGMDWTNQPGITGPTPCPSQTGVEYFTWAPSAANLSGDLTDMYTPLGYHLHLAYDQSAEGGGDYSLPTSVTAASQIVQEDGSSRTPTETFSYYSDGDLSSYSKGNGSWSMSYDAMNRLLVRTDPDSVSSYSCYYSDGAVQYTETASQHAADGAPSTCQTSSPSSSDSKLYDADGDTSSVIDHKGGTTGTTTNFYDGDDRLVEVMMPYDSRTVSNSTPTTPYEAYPFPWMTRYLYDLTEPGSTTPLGTPSISGVGTVSAYGNLFETEEWLPGNATVTAGTAPAAPAWLPTRGNSFDALDRALNKYELAFGSTPESSNTYDCNGESGLLCQVQNAMSQITSYTYDSDGHTSGVSFTGAAPLASNRNYTFDADGRTASVTSSMGTMTYTYDGDGRETMTNEPGGQTGATTVCYGYYADGTRSTLSLGTACPGGTSTVGGINQQNFLMYSYRPDGLLQSESVSWTAQGTFNWTYSPAGREQTQSDPVTGQSVTAYEDESANFPPTAFTETLAAKSIDYDAFGRVKDIKFPQGYAIGAPSYDTDDELESENLTYSAGSTAVFQEALTLNARGELLAGAVSLLSGTDGPNKGGSSQNFSQSANGTLLSLQPTSTSSGTQSGAIQIDARSGMALASQNPASSGSGIPGVLVDRYDSAGRQIEQDDEAGGLGTTATAGVARTYDAENHMVTGQPGTVGPNTSTAYSWGPDGHLRTIVEPDIYEPTSGTSTTYNLHWDGDALLFVNAGAGTVAYIGSLGTLDSTGTFAIIDRDQSGTQISMHGNNDAGSFTYKTWFSGWNITGPSLQQAGKTIAPGSGMFYGSCGGEMDSSGTSQESHNCPTSDIWISMARADGYLFGGFNFQGVRVYDPVSAQWLTPDAYAGDVHDPMSQKPFIWIRNNPFTYEDPSGYESGAVSLACSINRCEGAGVGPLTKKDWIDAGKFAVLALATVLTDGVADELAVGLDSEMSWNEAADMLQQAARGKGNFGIGSATEKDADALGQAWVGKGAHLSRNGKAWVGENGRIYRPGTYKPKLGKTQANLEQVDSNGTVISNAHIDIKPNPL
jgi:YD repeat-containing protein